MKSLFSRFKSGPNPNPNPPTSSRTSSSASHDPPPRSGSSSRPRSLLRSKRPSDASGISISGPSPSPSLASPDLGLPLPHSASASSSDSTRPRSAQAQLEDPSVEVWDHGRGRTISAGEAGGKKVTFRGPAPTPTTSVLLDEAVNVNGVGKPASDRTGSASPTKSSAKPRLTPQDSRPRPASRNSLPGSIRPSALRKASLPPLTAIRPSSSSQPSSASPTKTFSIRSPTPSESSAGLSTSSYLPQPNSWSEMAEDDLIANLGPRERTRQEVLWEIVSSEERYVQELVKLNDTFCRAMLPPCASTLSLDLFDPSLTLARTLSPSSSSSPVRSPSEVSLNHLPIASKYASARYREGRLPSDDSDTSYASEGAPPSASARMDAYSILTNGRPSEHGVMQQSSFAAMAEGASRSHKSLPPLPRSGSGQTSQANSVSASYTRMSFQTGKSKGHDSRVGSRSSISSLKGKDATPPLPEDLEKVLAVLAGGILQGHLKLAAALRKRYEDQYPLVRTLADVFTSHSYILREYKTYVLHLEKALAQVDDALSLALSYSTSKRHSRQLESTEQGRLGKFLLSLEELAAERGESGLVISLSKPFQRLLKYPLLFQNLLFNTDPSLREYEATLAMVDEVELIVRTIEDEKASWEERERTRDVWARIEGLEKDKVLMAPKPNRLLVSENQLSPAEGEKIEALVKQKKSLRRLSDILKGSEHPDLWVIRFSDVSLLCEKTGTTTLPTGSKKQSSSRSDSVPDLHGRGKYATTGRRSASIRARNLYRFVKVHEWHLKSKTGDEGAALLSKEDISRARRSLDGSASHRSLKSVDAGGMTNSSSMATITEGEKASSSPATPKKSGVAPPASVSPSTTPKRVPMKTTDGPSPARSSKNLARRDTDTETVASDRLSVMSFAFKGGEQVRPVRVRPKSAQVTKSSGTAPRPATGSATRPVPSSNNATTNTNSGGTAVQRRSSGGYVAGKAADAKFAHRLRSPDQVNSSQDGDSATIRPGSRTRRSLPPAMAARPVPPALSNGERNANVVARLNPIGDKAPVKPPWNSGGGLSGTTPSARAPSAAPASVSSRRIRPAGAGVSVVAPAVGPGGRMITPSASDDSGVAGLWMSYADEANAAARTPRAQRQYGGKI